MGPFADRFFLVRFYNQTKFGGLETHIPNAYCNSLLQALYYLPPVRASLVAHMSAVHTREFCLACELGFLFRMLDSCGGSNCHAGNFLRAFGRFVSAGARGLFESDDSTPSSPYLLLIQSFARFLLDQIHTETSEHAAPAPAPASRTPAAGFTDGVFVDKAAARALPAAPVQAVFAASISVRDRCQVCSNETVRQVNPLLLDLPARPVRLVCACYFFFLLVRSWLFLVLLVFVFVLLLVSCCFVFVF